MVIMGFWIWKDMKEKSARTSGQWILVLSYEFSVCLYLLEFRMLQLLFFFFNNNFHDRSIKSYVLKFVIYIPKIIRLLLSNLRNINWSNLFSY